MNKDNLSRGCRVRFAPSPSGDLHVGSARIAIVNARVGSHFTLRIDDTNASHTGDADAIVRDLNWLGIYPDRIVRSSDLNDFKANKLASLVAAGKAKVDGGAVYLPVPKRGNFWVRTLGPATVDRGYKMNSVSWLDVNFKSIAVPLSSIGTLPPGAKKGASRRIYLTRSDGSYLCDFASACDDIYLDIGTVICGADHVTNTAKQLLIYAALGEDFPTTIAHLPLLLDAGAKISKSGGSGDPWSLKRLRRAGILPEAVREFVAGFGFGSDATADRGRLENVNRKLMGATDPRTVAAMAGLSGNAPAVEIAAIGSFPTLSAYRDYVDAVRAHLRDCGKLDRDAWADANTLGKRLLLTGLTYGPDFDLLFRALRRSGALQKVF